jgi:hypothetical protein
MVQGARRGEIAEHTQPTVAAAEHSDRVITEAGILRSREATIRDFDNARHALLLALST